MSSSYNISLFVPVPAAAPLTNAVSATSFTCSSFVNHRCAPRPFLAPTPHTALIHRFISPIATATSPTQGTVSTPVDAKALKTAIVTGASSSIGLYAAQNLLNQGWFVVLAVRDIEKMKKQANANGFPEGKYTIIKCDLGDFNTVRSFVRSYEALKRDHLDAVVVNAAIWHPRDKAPRFTVDGIEETVAVNHLGHFLLCNLLVPEMKKSFLKTRSQTRFVFLATETHNPNTLPGKIPPQADLGDFAGMKSGLGNQTSGMIDGGKYEPTKAYKDSKACNILTMKEFNKRFSAQGASAVALFPGCIAESGLFREKRGWFRSFFPWFQKTIVKQYVSEREAGRRVADVVANPRYADSGSYYRWKGTSSNAEPIINQVSDEAMSEEKLSTLWDLSAKLVGI